jgi:hypothetical protein
MPALQTPSAAGEAGAGLSVPRRALFGGCLLVFVALLLEALLFAAGRASERVAVVLRGTSRAVPDARLGQRGNPQLPEHDARGWRNAERPERSFAVAIGDSQTYGDEVLREAAWPQRLAARSGRTVYNMAFGGYGPVEYERLQGEALELAPRVVLVGLYAGNDLADAYLSAYSQRQAPELRSADAALAVRCAELDAERELTDAWERTRDAGKGRRFPAASRILDRALEGSQLVALAGAVARALGGQKQDPRARDTSSGAFEKLRLRAARFGSDLLLPLDAGGIRTVLTPAARLALIDTRDARVEEGLRISVSSLLRMADACAGRCSLAVVGIPTKELVFAELARAGGAAEESSLAELALRETLFWERTRRALAEAGIPLVDALPALRALLAEGRNPYRSDHNGHPLGAGNEAIAEAVLASGVLDAPVRAAAPSL